MSKIATDLAKFHSLFIGLRVLWFGSVLACLVYLFIEITGDRYFDTSVVALLPDNNQEISALANSKLMQSGEERIVFLVSSENKKESLEAVQKVYEFLEGSNIFGEMQGRVDEEQIDQWQQTFFHYRYSYLTFEDRRALSSEAIDSNNPILQRAIARIYSPMAASVTNTLNEDPLQLYFQWLSEQGQQSNFTVESDWLSYQHDNRFYRLVSANLKSSAYDMSYQKEVKNVVGTLQNSIPPTVSLQVSGLLFHAAYGAEQAKKEISKIGLGSVVGIAFILIFVLKQVRSLLVAFLPIVVGVSVSLAICLLVFERLNLITLAFGAGLVGVAIDYSLHYLCANFEIQDDGNGNLNPSVISRILPAISLGLLSSVIAYAAQAVAPFPGLRQMALFSVCGLIAAWLTVVLWFPILVKPINKDSENTHPLGLLASLTQLLSRWPSTASKLVSIILIIVVVLCAYVVTHSSFDDDIRRLQTSPQSMLDNDAEIQRLIGGINPGQYFVVSAKSQEQLLQVQEKLALDLDKLVSNGDIASYQSLSTLVPSLKRQNENRSLLNETVYSDEKLLDLFAAQLASPQLVTSATSAFNNSREQITIETWLQSPIAETMFYLFLGEFEGEFHALVALAGIRELSVIDDLNLLAGSHQRVIFVDNVGTISEVLKTHRLQIQQWLVLAYIVVLCLLVWRYGLSAWRLLAAPALASLLAIAILGVSPTPLNIFSFLALLLVLGIGLDASIFLKESKRSAYTWVAVSLSTMTTLLAFGLLSLSKTPVLHQFGLTVLIGIIGVWLLTPCFIINDSAHKQVRAK